jgi:hypothetical protein
MTYTKEQIELLKSILTWRIHTDNFLHYTVLKVHGGTQVVWAHELDRAINGHTQPIWGFLHATPLEEVPLYINTIPELARWRLMIAK